MYHNIYAFLTNRQFLQSLKQPAALRLSLLAIALAYLRQVFGSIEVQLLLLHSRYMAHPSHMLQTRMIANIMARSNSYR